MCSKPGGAGNTALFPAEGEERAHPVSQEQGMGGGAESKLPLALKVETESHSLSDRKGRSLHSPSGQEETEGRC